MNKTFPFGEIFKATLKTLFVNFSDWMKLIAAPAALILAGVALTSVDVAFVKLILVLVGFVLNFAASVIFAVRVYRYVIEGEMPEKTWSLEWNRRHWMTILYGIAVGLLVGCMVVVLGLPVGLFMALGTDVNVGVAIIYGVIAIIALIVLGLRFSAVMGLVAIDAPAPIKESWQMINGRVAFKILGLILALVIPMMVYAFIIAIPFLIPDLGIAWLLASAHTSDSSQVVDGMRMVMEGRVHFVDIANLLLTGLSTFGFAHVIKSLRSED